MSVFWLNALPARFCTCWPTPPPSRFPTALPTAFTPLPAAPLMVPSISNEPLSGVVIVSTPGWPDIVNGPRDTLKLSCASDINLENGFCGLPDKLRGALASSASRIAVIAIAAGASTTDVPASGCSGCIATSAGRPCCSAGAAGHNTFNSTVAPMKDVTTIAAPKSMVRRFMKSAGIGFVTRSLGAIAPRPEGRSYRACAAARRKHLVRRTRKREITAVIGCELQRVRSLCGRAEFPRSKETEYHEKRQHRDLRDHERRFRLRRSQFVQSGNLEERLNDADERIEVQRRHRGHDINPAPRAGEMKQIVAGDGDNEQHQRQDADRTRRIETERRQRKACYAGQNCREKKQRRPTAKRATF